MRTFAFLAGSALLGGLLSLPAAQVRAAESFDACAGFIDSVPATIATPGVWCLRRDLSTAMSSGAAIAIDANNITIDCNAFRLGGLAAGSASTTFGIAATGRTNIAVRNCNVRGFYAGIWLSSGTGHTVQDNRLDNNLRYGIFASGAHTRVIGNAVYDTGGSPGVSGVAISGGSQIIDNVVSGVVGSGAHQNGVGIYASDETTLVRGNSIAGVVASGNGTATGLQVWAGTRVADNHLVNLSPVVGRGIHGQGTPQPFCTGNTVAGYTTASIGGCRDSGGNDSQ